MDRWKAKEGYLWVCLACGRFGTERDKIGDESCFLNAQQYPKDSLRFDEFGKRVIKVEN